MGHIEVNPAKRKSLDLLPIASRQNALNQQKPAHASNQIELTGVRLQRPVKCVPPGFHNSALWSVDGIDGIQRIPRFMDRSKSSRTLSPEDQPLTSPSNDENVAPTPCSEASGNQGEGCESAHVCDNLPKEFANIQRSASAPVTDKSSFPVKYECEMLESLQLDGFEPTVGGTTDSDAHSDAPDSPRDMWSNSSDDFDGSFASIGTTSVRVCPMDSPETSDPHYGAQSPFDQAPIFTYESHDEYSRSLTGAAPDVSRRKSGVFSATAGMTLIDRIQEDFPRTPSPVFGPYPHDELKPAYQPGPFLVDDDISGALQRTHLGENGRTLRQGLKHPQDVHGYSQRLGARNYPAVSRISGHPYSKSFMHTAYATSMYSPQASHSPFLMHPGMIATGKPSWSHEDQSFYQYPVTPTNFPPTPQAFGSNNRHVPTYYQKYAMQENTRTSSKVAPNQYRFHDYEPRHDYSRPAQNNFQRPMYEVRGCVDPARAAVYSYSFKSLLEELKSSPTNTEKWELLAIKGHLVSFAKDQTGSRFIQQKLEKADENTREDAFEEIYPEALVLMTDIYGNYVIQKFFDHGSSKQHQLLVNLLKTNMLALALQVYGCRVIQKALETTSVVEQLSLINELKGHVTKCAQDQNGNHVLQKCIEVASWSNNFSIVGNHEIRRQVACTDVQFIIDGFIGKVAELSTHTYGCRVVQRILEHCSPEQIRPVLSEIIYDCRELVKDQFGNYVVQHVISHGEDDQRDVVKRALIPDIARWSQHKYASNVVEKCLDNATPSEIHDIVNLVLDYDESGSGCAFLVMMKHMYANYVVQKLLDKADKDDLKRLYCIIDHNRDHLRNFTFGKHVLSHKKLI